MSVLEDVILNKGGQESLKKLIKIGDFDKLNFPSLNARLFTFDENLSDEGEELIVLDDSEDDDEFEILGEIDDFEVLA